MLDGQLHRSHLNGFCGGTMMRRFIKTLAPKRGNKCKDNPESHPHVRQAEDDHVAGLKTIYEGMSSCVDIVAIHGDGGHYKESWTHPENQVFWLRDLLPDIVPDSRVVSFGYSASKRLSFLSAEEISLVLLRELLRLRKDSASNGKRAILFVAHSFGVLLLKGALALASSSSSSSSSSSEYEDIISSTRGIIFFGSPPDISQKLQGLVSMTQSTVPESAALIAMKEDLTWLHDRESEYSKLEKEGTFEVTYFLESSGNGGEEHETRTESTPADDEQVKSLRMRKTHGMMIRFLDAEDEDFGRVKECIEKIVKNSRA